MAYYKSYFVDRYDLNHMKGDLAQILIMLAEPSNLLITYGHVNHWLCEYLN